ncbi:MAG: sulfite exporter TauE/SafE family protein [Alphaproteobacteria bacterium]|nr:MAG: sulfite exporter TauE/SafE family protein [Alphaproteobacteria bacterium]
MAGIGEALALEGLWLLLTGAALAGLVRGFSGFGTAMIYLPFAARVLDPVWVLVTLLVIDLIGPLPQLPRALREGEPRDVARLAGGAALGVVAGVAVLVSFSAEPFRYAVSLITLALLLLLVSGLRWRGELRAAMIWGTGALGGFLGGAVGLPGPPVILFYMARPLPPQVIRANIMVYLVAVDAMMMALFAFRGLLEPAPVMVGLVVAPVYLVGVWLGGRIFDPARERLYRFVAYAIIAGSAMGGLPLWD